MRRDKPSQQRDRTNAVNVLSGLQLLPVIPASLKPKSCCLVPPSRKLQPVAALTCSLSLPQTSRWKTIPHPDLR